jgi:hypothetical protein
MGSERLYYLYNAEMNARMPLPFSQTDSIE